MTTKTAHKQKVGAQETGGYIDASVPLIKSTQISTSASLLEGHIVKKDVFFRNGAPRFLARFLRGHVGALP